MYARKTDQEMLAESFEEEFGHTLPTHKEVCDDCRGEGQNSKHLGAFTGEEMWEMGEDFREGYMRGDYDQICQTCDGLRVVDEVNEALLTREELEYVRDWWRDVADSYAISRQERMMGA